MSEKFDYLDLLKYLNNKSLSYEIAIKSTKPKRIDGNMVATALAGLNQWVQAWAYILANHQARQSDMYMCQRILMSVLYAEMAHCKHISHSQKLIQANNMAWGAITASTHYRHQISKLKKAELCSIDKQTFYRTYSCFFERAEQEIAVWENQIRDQLKQMFKD